MDEQDIRTVIDCWAGQFRELGARPEIQYVQIFENRGATMGASNPHPHCQIWSTTGLPNIPKAEQDSQTAYRKAKNSCLLCDYYSVESSAQLRIVVQNEHFLAVVPYWAVWPFETMIVSKRHLGAINDGIDHPTGAAIDSPVIEIVIHNNAACMLFACAT